MKFLPELEDKDEDLVHSNVVHEIFSLMKLFVLSPFGGYMMLRLLGFYFFGAGSPKEEKWASQVNFMFTAQVLIAGLQVVPQVIQALKPVPPPTPALPFPFGPQQSKP